MEAYLDNSATTKVSQSVKDVVVKTMTEDFGNPSSMHMKGVEAERYLRNARETIAKLLKVSEKEIIFTSGGTESNNLALIGMAMANKRAGTHIITSSVEHASVLNTMKYLEEQGFEVTYLPVDHMGRVKLDALKEALRQDTILVSVMYVNNEIGAVEPIEEISKIVKAYNPKIIFHVDGIQAFGKYRIYPKKIGIDALSVSGHKIHGPKGVGFLYVSEKVKIRPIIFGGGQQKGMRSGTDNVPGIAGIAQAAKEAYDRFEEKTAKMYELKDYFIERLMELDNVKINSCKGEESSPHIISVSFVGVRSEVMLHALEDKKIYVSAGSACSSNHPHISETLSGIKLSPEEIDSAIRFSMCEKTTKEELDYAVDTIAGMISTLRKFTRRK
ncbi:MAG: cysteine desulfurase family protein [Lachnospiraceae bacterium]|nr:cysteine desulfurase family protein [Lachnospiraceae bacterium]